MKEKLNEFKEFFENNYIIPRKLQNKYIYNILIQKFQNLKFGIYYRVSFENYIDIYIYENKFDLAFNILDINEVKYLNDYLNENKIYASRNDTTNYNKNKYYYHSNLDGIQYKYSKEIKQLILYLLNRENLHV